MKASLIGFADVAADGNALGTACFSCTVFHCFRGLHTGYTLQQVTPAESRPGTCDPFGLHGHLLDD